MRARIVSEGGFFVGQVYGTWRNLILGTSWEGWETVTDRCFTKLGARMELQLWKNEHYTEEIEL